MEQMSLWWVRIDSSETEVKLSEPVSIQDWYSYNNNSE